MTTLNAECEAAVQRWVDAAPPLSEAQRDIIAAAMRGAVTPKTKPPHRVGAAVARQVSSENPSHPEPTDHHRQAEPRHAGG